MIEMSVGLKRLYRVIISALLILIGWVVFAKFITYISFSEFLAVELIVMGSGMLGHYLKKHFGLDLTEEKKDGN